MNNELAVRKIYGFELRGNKIKRVLYWSPKIYVDFEFTYVDLWSVVAVDPFVDFREINADR